VLGTQIDWVEDKLGAMFVFKNPNEKARCGCGESFSV
jgi:iron-sulfur cluster assembly accessory protein